MEGDSEATRSRPCSVRPCPGLSSNIHMQPLSLPPFQEIGDYGSLGSLGLGALALARGESK